MDLLRRDQAVDAYVIQAPTIAHEMLEEIMESTGVTLPILPHDRGEGVAAADIALSSSGTATLEAAVLGTPAVVMYRLSPLTYALARRLVKLPNFSLVNIIAGRQIVPELIQGEVEPVRIAGEVRRVMEPGRYDALRAELAEVRSKLGEPGASERVALEIVRLVSAAPAAS